METVFSSKEMSITLDDFVRQYLNPVMDDLKKVEIAEWKRITDKKIRRSLMALAADKRLFNRT